MSQMELNALENVMKELFPKCSTPMVTLPEVGEDLSDRELTNAVKKEFRKSREKPLDQI